ncbi:trypsin-like serine protease [Photobacterium leiognathi]|uniref:trypsin-like serine protease n=1 Tax=Photobacterium leiognathi TaxID=553611 RepID=UPI00076AC576|nr:trypsin-like serine protease [Photobacterium leiognathi]
MNKNLIISVLAVLPLILAAPANADLKINGGSDTTPKEFPYFTSVYKHFKYNDTSDVIVADFTCGGVIVAGHYLLSASHCFVEDSQTGVPWWDGQKIGNQHPKKLWGHELIDTIIDEDLIVGLETTDINRNKPKAYEQLVNISGENSKWTDSDWSSYFDIIVIDLAKYINKDFQLEKAVYLGNPVSLQKETTSNVIGFGDTLCGRNGNCDESDSASTHLLKTKTKLDTECTGLRFEEYPEPLPYFVHYAQKDEYVCSKSLKYKLPESKNKSEEGYSNANHGDSGGPIIITEHGNDFTYGVTHVGTLVPFSHMTNKTVIYQTFSKNAIDVITQQINGWNAPTVVEVSEIGKNHNVTVQNLTINDVNLFDSEDLVSSDNITLNSDSDCNRLTKPFETCQLSFNINDEKEGFVELRNSGKSLKINVVNNSKSDDLIPYDDKKTDDLIPYDDQKNDDLIPYDNNDNGGGGSLNFISLFMLLGMTLQRKRKVSR